MVLACKRCTEILRFFRCGENACAAVPVGTQVVRLAARSVYATNLRIRYIVCSGRRLPETAPCFASVWERRQPWRKRRRVAGVVPQKAFNMLLYTPADVCLCSFAYGFSRPASQLPFHALKLLEVQGGEPNRRREEAGEKKGNRTK